MRVLLILVISFWLSGCLNTQNISSDFIVNYPKFEEEGIKEETFKNYVLEEKKSVYVGDAIIKKEFVKKYYKNTFLLKFVPNINFRDINKEGMYEIKGYSEKDFNSKYIYISTVRGSHRYLKLNESGKLLSNDMFDFNGNSVESNYINDDKLKFEAIKIKDNLDSKKSYLDGSYKFELIYNGKIDNNIKILYREFSEDLARVAYYQELTYNLNESKTLRYKNFKLEVIDATNEKIVYKVLSD